MFSRFVVTLEMDLLIYSLPPLKNTENKMPLLTVYCFLIHVSSQFQSYYGLKLREKHDMAKSQLKQNQLYLIKLIVKDVTNLKIIQPQFLIGQHFLVFDKRKFFKKVKSETPPPPPPLKRENDVSRDKSIFDSYHVVIFTHMVKAFSLVYFTICVNLLLPHIILIQICHKFGIY